MMKFSELFRFMMERKALELHMVPGSPIMLRDKNNLLTPVDSNILTPNDTKRFVSEVISEEKVEEFEKRLEVEFAYSVPGLSRYRINIFMQRNSISVIIKTVPTAPPTFEELGIPDMFKNFLMKVDRGLILLCGPKSGGKSHTLAAIVNYILENKVVKIVTIENPIKFLFKNKKGIVCQRELGIDVKDLKTAFDSLPHLGADIIVINDIESFEVAQKILTMAAGGHLVIVTAIAQSVQVIIEKIINLYPPTLQGQAKVQLSEGLEAIFVQSLLKKATGDGYIPAFEIMIANGPIKARLREAKLFEIQQIMGSTGRDVGMITQEQSLRGLVKRNLITQEEAYSKATRPEEFKKVMMIPI